MVTTTALYAGMLALISIVLGYLAGSLRGRLGISVGDAGNKDLLVAVRRHANFTEYVPLIVVMMAMIELNGAPKLWVHLLGIAIVVARIAHPIGIGHDQMSSPFRLVGAALTALVTVASGLILLLQAINALAGG